MAPWGLLHAHAADASQPMDAAHTLGPWIFASVALVLVGLLACLIGYLAGRRSVADAPHAPRAHNQERQERHERHERSTAGPSSSNPTDEGAQVAAMHPATVPPGLVAGSPATAHPATPQPAPSSPPSTSTLAEAPGATTAAEEVKAFSYTISHDLRAPLRVVDGFARILKEDYGRQLDRIGNDHLDRVLGAAARMNAMIDAVLTLANLSAQPLVRQPVDLSQIALFIVEDLHRATPQRQVQVEIEPGLKATGDPTLLRQALENLLSNAWKYTGRCDAPAIGFRSLVIDDRPCFEVQDNGAGFDMRSADRLFGLFQRLHSASEFPGTGVGLASVRRIIQRHGGDIWAESQPGQGTRFRFTLGAGPWPRGM